MNRPLRLLFRDLVLLAGAVPLAACASTVVPEYDGAPPADAVLADGASCRPIPNNDTCAQSEDWRCGIPVVVPTLAFQTGPVCDTLCPDFVGQSFFNHSCQVIPADGGGAIVNCVLCRTGRRPEGWTLAPTTNASTPLGGFFAGLAELEAASIPAFRALLNDLIAHGAPSSLIEMARAAIVDERAHTRAMGALAKRFGAAPRTPRVKRRGVDSIEAVATMNAVEGCVGETFGALIATFQARHAADAMIRQAMTRIAEDETRHAELAQQVANWADGLLDDAARERVSSARTRALDTLREEASLGVHDDLIAFAGMPTARQARALVDALAPAIEAMSPQRTHALS